MQMSRARNVPIVALTLCIALLLAGCSSNLGDTHLESLNNSSTPLVNKAKGSQAIQLAESALLDSGYSFDWSKAVYSTAPDLDGYISLPENYTMLVVPVVGHDSAVLNLGFDGSVLAAASIVAVGWDGNLVICHYPPGKPTNPQSIEIEQEAVRAHFVNHDDTIGSCFADGTSSTAQEMSIVRQVRLLDGTIMEASGTASLATSTSGEVRVEPVGALQIRHYAWQTPEDIADALEFPSNSSLSLSLLNEVTLQDHCVPHPLYCPTHPPTDGDGNDEGDAGGGGTGDDGGDEGSGDVGGGGSATCDVPASLEYNLASAESAKTGAIVMLWSSATLFVASTGGAAAACGIPGVNVATCWFGVGGAFGAGGAFIASTFNADSAYDGVRAAEAAIDEWIDENCSPEANVGNNFTVSQFMFQDRGCSIV